MADLSNIWEDQGAPGKPQGSTGGIIETGKKFLSGDTNYLKPVSDTVYGVGETAAALATGMPADIYGRIIEGVRGLQGATPQEAEEARNKTIERYQYAPRTETGRYLTEKIGAALSPMFIPGEEVQRVDRREGVNPAVTVVRRAIADIVTGAVVGKVATGAAQAARLRSMKAPVVRDYAAENVRYAEAERAKAFAETQAEADSARAGNMGVEEYGIPEYREALQERIRKEGLRTEDNLGRPRSQQKGHADLSDIWTEGELAAYGTTAEVPAPPDPVLSKAPEARAIIPPRESLDRIPAREPELVNAADRAQSENALRDAIVNDARLANENDLLMKMEEQAGSLADEGTPARPVEAVRPEGGNPSLDGILKDWNDRGISSWAYEKNGAIYLSEIHIPKERRGAGVGAQAMQELTDYADKTNQKILLTPSTDFGGSSVARLEKFYRRFGFESNKGGKKDYRYIETMIRRPIPNPARPVEAVKPVESAIETDHARVQEIKNSIAEGEGILKHKKKVSGAKYSPEELQAVQRSVDNAKKKIGEASTKDYAKPSAPVKAPAPENTPAPVKGNGAYSWDNIKTLIDEAPDTKKNFPVEKRGSRWVVTFNGRTKGGPTTYTGTPERLFDTKEKAVEFSQKKSAEHGTYPEGTEQVIIGVAGTKYKIWNTKETLNAFRDAMRREFNKTEFRKILGSERGSSPEIGDLAEFGYDVFVDLAKSTEEAIKITAKELPKAGAVAGEREKGKYAAGEVVKHRSVTGSGGEKLKAPPVFEGEKAIMQEVPELPRKPMGGLTENPLRTFEQLGTKAKELIYRPVKEAEKVWHQEMTDLRAELSQVRKGVSFLSGDRIGAYAIAQQKKGAELLAAMGKEVPTLTPKEMQVYEWMRGKLDGLYSRLQESRQMSGLEPFGKVENYFTFFNDLSLLQEMGFNPITAPMAAMEEAFIHMKATPFGFAKKRSGAIHPIKTDAFLVFDRYADKALQHINLSPIIAKGRELLGGFEDGFLLKNEKPNTAKFLTDWLDFVSGQRMPEYILDSAPALRKGLQALNKNLAFSVLSANIRSALIQPSSLVNTVAELGVRYTLEGIKGLMEFSEGKRSAVSEAMKKSNVLLGREFDANVAESMTSVKGVLSGARQKAGEIGLKPLQLLDMESARATWIGAYRKAIAKGLLDRDAINYADDTVTRTQASAQRSDLAPVQRTTLGKTATLFQTFTINSWGFLTRDVLGIGNKAITNKEAFVKATRFVIGAALVNALFEDVLGTQSPMPSPVHEFVKKRDEGGTTTEAAIAAALEAGTVAPFFGGTRFGSSPLGATADFMKDVSTKVASESGRKAGLTKTWPELAGKAAGVPGVAQVAKTVRGMEHGKTIGEALLGTENRATEGSRRLKTMKSRGMNSLRELR